MRDYAAFRPIMTGTTPPASLISRDRAAVWHPYASVTEAAPLFSVDSADGVYLNLSDGRRLIDGMSSWWAAIHGYNHPLLNAAAQAQLGKMSHVMFGGLTHEPAVQLCETLLAIAPGQMDKVFLSDSGSVAVEVAIKMALQFQANNGQPGRSKLMALRGGYHGDTFAAMSVCDPVTGMHHLFKQVLAPQIFADRPAARFGEAATAGELAALDSLFETHQHELAAVIVEPLIQGAGGMWFYSAAYLSHLRALCDSHGVLLIFDEIATAFGRCGDLFAANIAAVTPDILCVGKALTGGYLSLAATITSKPVAEVICGGEAGALMHGPTFMANPLACAIANASLELLLNSDWRSNIGRLERGLRAGLAPAAQLPQVADVRVMGAIGVIELHEPVNMAEIQPQFVERGVWVRPFGKLVYSMPPYIMNDSELSALCAAIVDTVTGT